MEKSDEGYENYSYAIQLPPMPVRVRMGVEYIARRIDVIREQLHDEARAHLLEDELYVDVLHAIARDPSNAQELAEAVLAVGDLDFKRVYA